MPFIVQCPHSNCLKYMLLEDESQGQSVACLVCNQDIHLGGPPPAAPPEDEVIDLTAFERREQQPLQSAGESEEPTSNWRFLVKKCPKCNTPLKIPPDKVKQAVSCTECNFWGLIF